MASLALTLRKSGSCEVSVFSGEPASPRQIAVCVQKLHVAFPQMDVAFFNLLSERIVKNRMSSDRLEYAVGRVLDNFTYKTLTIADVLSSDLKCRFYTYPEMLQEIGRIGGNTDDYAPIRVSGSEKPAWIRKADKALYKIPDAI